MFFGEWPVPDAPALLTRIANRVLEARESGTTVIFVQNDGPEGELDAPGMPYWQLALAPGAGERVVNKTTQNVFESNPNLASELQESGIKTLELIGLQSELCLYSSVLGALENGFMVDGKDVYSLSGSTLDILGLAIRVALTKTFLPHCRFLLLDEPFAACDAQRQAQALGFIHTLGFDQIIIVTHDNLTEAVADHVIEL